MRKAKASIALIALISVVASSWYLYAARDARHEVISLRDGERFVFVNARDMSEVAVIDGKLDRVAARVAMPSVPKQLLVSEPTGTLVASVAGSSSLDIVELMPANGRARIDLGMEANNLVLSPDGYLVGAHSARAGVLAVASLQTRRLLFRLPHRFDPRHFVSAAQRCRNRAVESARTRFSP